LKNKTELISKIYIRAFDYFSGISEDGYVLDKVSKDKFITFKKRGSDLCYKITLGEHDHIYLEITQINSTLSRGNSFNKSVAGTIEYELNGDCANKRKVCLPNKRQQIELQEVVDHVQRSIRPNSINFIMDD